MVPALRCCWWPRWALLPFRDLLVPVYGGVTRSSPLLPDRTWPDTIDRVDLFTLLLHAVVFNRAEFVDCSVPSPDAPSRLPLVLVVITVARQTLLVLLLLWRWLPNPSWSVVNLSPGCWITHLVDAIPVC